MRHVLLPFQCVHRWSFERYENGDGEIVNGIFRGEENGDCLSFCSHMTWRSEENLRYDLKMNADKNKVMVLEGEGGSVCTFIVDGR